jgi:acetyltransferase-like isoleucine patch superfamily enzyme
MSDGRMKMALAIVRANGVGGIAWALGMALMLARANLKLLLSLSPPGLIFAGRMARLQGMRHASIGRHARIAAFCRITAWKGGVMRIGRNFSLGEGSIIENGFNIAAKKGLIEIGDNVGIGAFSFISCPSRVRLGSDCIIGQYFSVHAQDHRFGGQGLIRLQGTTEQGIEIGDNCWIGAKVTVVDGVTIGSGCVIAAGAVVTRSFPDNSVIGGVPARLLRQRD